MLVTKNLYYVLVILLIGNVFMMITNITGFAKKNDTEVKVSHQSSIQENLLPLTVTGRRELNGFKGYRHYRRGYRRYSDDWWYPEVAFVTSPHSDAKHVSRKAAAISKKRIFSEERKPWMLKQHIKSCMARYRSYNKNDNSYQPFHGPRKQCFSSVFKG
ncbi:BA14K family protein [Bartonella sp. CB74]|uniref:BA14K family protein n=1 Tax=Bartonella sp. CB74 TaxID=3113620 RepID=UPI002F968267